MAAGSTKSFRGLVIRRRYATGSKSEHEAICLLDGEGQSFKLRRLGGDPYADAALERLLGKRIVADGRMIADHTLLLSTWSEIEDPPPPTVASRRGGKPRPP